MIHVIKSGRIAHRSRAVIFFLYFPTELRCKFNTDRNPTTVSAARHSPITFSRHPLTVVASHNKILYYKWFRAMIHLMVNTN